MPKKKKINCEEHIIPKRPHRQLKTKIVFDPSDTHVPKKRSKYSYTKKKPMEAINMKKTTNDGRKQQDTTKSKSCFICSKILGKTELIDCPICFIKVHKHCLIVSEPMWKFKLDLGPWFCKQCRKQNCHKCLKDESQSEILCRCITCEVGLHIDCYDSYEMKPLQKLETNMYVCMPCMTLAIQINPEEEDVVEAEQLYSDDDVKSRTSSNMSISSDEDDTDSESSISDSSSGYNKNDEFKISNISKWNKQQVFEYLSEKLPEKIVHQITKFKLDGQAVLLLQRTDIISNMGMNLGHSLKFYKEVRILQTQSTRNSLYWQ